MILVLKTEKIVRQGFLGGLGLSEHLGTLVAKGVKSTGDLRLMGVNDPLRLMVLEALRERDAREG